MPWDRKAAFETGAQQVAGHRAIVLGSSGLPAEFLTALEQLDVEPLNVPDLASLHEAIPRLKPDLVLSDLAGLGDDPGLQIRCMRQAKLTETLPIIAFGASDLSSLDPAVSCALSEVLTERDVGEIGYFLICGALRRERPQILAQPTSYGALSFDPRSYSLAVGGRTATLRKLDFCVIGAMIDAPERQWERELLCRLVFEPSRRKEGRDLDFYISRVRQYIRSQTDHDPIISVRGVGYALNPIAADPCPWAT